MTRKLVSPNQKSYLDLVACKPWVDTYTSVSTFRRTCQPTILSLSGATTRLRFGKISIYNNKLPSSVPAYETDKFLAWEFIGLTWKRPLYLDVAVIYVPAYLG